MRRQDPENAGGSSGKVSKANVAGDVPCSFECLVRVWLIDQLCDLFD